MTDQLPFLGSHSRVANNAHSTKVAGEEDPGAGAVVSVHAEGVLNREADLLVEGPCEWHHEGKVGGCSE